MPTVTNAGTITRDQAIAKLRQALVALTDEETSICKVAAERGIFCQGYRKMSDAELRDRYWWIVRRQPDISRLELERLANAWQAAQTQVQRLPLACDVQTKSHDTCGGWHDFTNDQLASFYRQVIGADVIVV